MTGGSDGIALFRLPTTTGSEPQAPTASAQAFL